eukprot:6211321-Pleurochrysis_carterae.AAC.3
MAAERVKLELTCQRVFELMHTGKIPRVTTMREFCMSSMSLPCLTRLERILSTPLLQAMLRLTTTW